MSALDVPLFDVPESMWVRRRCQVCGCALSRQHDYTYIVQRQVFVKIGATSKPRRRLNELARPAWRKHVLYPVGMDWNQPLEVLAVIGGDVEHELHQMFARFHVFGEWFADSRPIREWIKEVTG